MIEGKQLEYDIWGNRVAKALTRGCSCERDITMSLEAAFTLAKFTAPESLVDTVKRCVDELAIEGRRGLLSMKVGVLAERMPGIPFEDVVRYLSLSHGGLSAGELEILTGKGARLALDCLYYDLDLIGELYMLDWQSADSIAMGIAADHRDGMRNRVLGLFEIGDDLRSLVESFSLALVEPGRCEEACSCIATIENLAAVMNHYEPGSRSPSLSRFIDDLDVEYKSELRQRWIRGLLDGPEHKSADGWREWAQAARTLCIQWESWGWHAESAISSACLLGFGEAADDALAQVEGLAHIVNNAANLGLRMTAERYADELSTRLASAPVDALSRADGFLLCAGAYCERVQQLRGSSASDNAKLLSYLSLERAIRSYWEAGSGNRALMNHMLYGVAATLYYLDDSALGLAVLQESEFLRSDVDFVSYLALLSQLQEDMFCESRDESWLHRALETVNRAIGETERSPSPWDEPVEERYVDRASVLIRLGRLGGAEDDIDKAIEFERDYPTDRSVALGLGVTLQLLALEKHGLRDGGRIGKGLRLCGEYIRLLEEQEGGFPIRLGRAHFMRRKLLQMDGRRTAMWKEYVIAARYYSKCPDDLPIDIDEHAPLGKLGDRVALRVLSVVPSLGKVYSRKR